MASPRVIVCAAIRFYLEDGTEEIICGVRHMDRFMQEAVRTKNRDTRGWKQEQGFVDNRYQFLNRKEALLVATEAGQINVRREKTFPTDLLFSEDLY